MEFNYENSAMRYINHEYRNSEIYSRTLFGQSILKNPVPVWTADKKRNPYVTFQDPKTGNIIGLTQDMLSLGMLVVGVPGSGKTNFLNMNLSKILENMNDGDCIIIFDTKGDYLSEFGERIAKEHKIVIGTGEKYHRITAYHNIFAEIMPRGKDGKLVYTEDSDVDAMEISRQLFQSMGSETQPIFPAMAEQIFCAVLIYYMRTFWRSDQTKLNNREIIHFFTDNTNEEIKKVLNLKYMQDQKSCIDYIENKSNQTQGVNSYIGSVLKKLFIGPFAKSDPSREFSMREVICGEQKKIIFIEYDLKRGIVLSPMYAILIDRALAYALGGRQEVKTNKYFLLDELLLISDSLQHLGDALNFGRSQGVKMMCGIQNISGLENQYGEAGAKNILSSFQNMIVFRLDDYDTRQFIVNRMGMNYCNYSFSAQQKNLNIQREGYTVEDWQLRSLKLGEAVISLAREAPFLFTIPKYQSNYTRRILI